MCHNSPLFPFGGSRQAGVGFANSSRTILHLPCIALNSFLVIYAYGV
jgi:hypothetical protein